MKILVSEADLLNTYKIKKVGKENIKRYSNLLPLYHSVELAEIVADLFTDGFMDIRKRKFSNYYSYIAYFSEEINELERFNSNLFKLFNIKGEIKNWGVRDNGSSLGVIVLNSFLTRLLYCCGVPGGDKVIQSYLLPDWIYNSNLEIKRAFLRRIYSCE
jgi:intein/homing endonuclease